LSTGHRENLAHLKNKISITVSDLSDPEGEWIKVISKVDAVVHLAALADIVPSIQHPDAYFKSNVSGTFHLLQACRHQGIKRFIYAASSSCYGLTQEIPTPESAAIQPEYPYALTKRLGEELVLHYAKVYELPALSFRFFNVYGTRSRTSGTYGAMFGVFLAQKLAGKPYTVIGDGTQTRDFVYVTDVARALLLGLKSDKSNEIYNVGAGRPVSINRVTEILGGDRVHIPKRPGEPDCTHADIQKIKNDLGWTPTISIEEGIKKLLQSIDYWKNAPVWDPKSIQQASADWFKYLGKSTTHEKNNFV
jgi:UDP-glucose 4-epimerase